MSWLKNVDCLHVLSALNNFAFKKTRVVFGPDRITTVIVIALWMNLGTLIGNANAWQENKIDFQSQVKPILSDHCFACHGPDSTHREADLRLDQLGSVVGDDLFIVPGEPDKSSVWERISTEDNDLRMPPIDSHKDLTNEQKKILRQWIAEGATFADHWAFVSPVKPVVPVVAGSETINPIDAFINRKLNSLQLETASLADKRTLIRRLSLDLTGLPPTLEEIEAFEKDQTDTAYASLVQRLLDSPNFGEHMAIHWLDQARYADTNGYSIDGGRNMWLWRDWVIDAYNRNMPYDQFIIQQMAGDLLPEATVSQKVATGFHRNHSITHEGGTIPEENLVNYVADRIKTTGETFMGLTLACAQCHDHKFDPISQRDYYQIYAYFNTVDDRGLDGDGGRNSVPHMDAPWMLPDVESERNQLESELAVLKTKMAAPLSGQSRWEQAELAKLKELGRGLELFPLEVLKVTEPNRGDPFDVREDGLVFVPSPWGRSPSVSARLPIEKLKGKSVTGIRIEFQPDDGFPNKGLGHGSHPELTGNFLLTSFSVSNTEVPSDQVDLYRQVEIANVTASSSHGAHPPEHCLDPRDFNGWAPSQIDSPQHISFSFSRPIQAADSPYMTSMLVWGGGQGLVAGKYRFFAMTGNDDGTNLPAEVQAILQKKTVDRSAEEIQKLSAYYSSVAPELKNIRANIKTLENRIRDLNSLHSTMVMNESTNPRKTHILNRGQYDQPGEEVSAAIPEALPKLGEFPPNRLGLAQWLTSPENPLTSRVAVNRIWYQLFGRGIVHPTADFGSQGSPPTHPELLNYLAVEFVQSGWDVKKLIALIVDSDAYKRSSVATADQLEVDPENRWLARGARYRLSAEVIRDSALSISGNLVNRIGGPPVFPYQPADLWREVSHFGSTPATAQVFVADQGENLYRRSIYTFWKRTVPPPSMVTFDAPNREICTMDRAATNTPLQALVLLNDVQFVESARGLATRILNQSGTDEQHLHLAFEMATAREPSSEEMTILQKTLHRERQKFQGSTEGADALVEAGQSDVMQQVERPELAAWTVVCQMILNLSETVTRE